MANINKNASFMEFPLQIARQYAAPVDKYAVWYSLSEAEAYALSSPLSYVGQIIAVVNETSGAVDVYKINNDGTLGEIGSKVQGDNKSIVADENGSLRLLGFGETYGDNKPFEAGLQLTTVVDENGGFKLAWIKPDTTTVEGLTTAVESLGERVGGLESVGAEKNLINVVKVNGTTLSINTEDRSVDIDAVSNETYNGLADIVNEHAAKLEGLTGAMHFVGKFDSLPATDSYAAGDVCIVDKKEYILTEQDGAKLWVEFGNEGDHLTEAQANEIYRRKDENIPLAEIIGIDTLAVKSEVASDIENAVSSANNYTDTKVNSLETRINETIATLATKTEVSTAKDEAIAAAKTETEGQVSQATANLTALINGKNVGVTKIIAGGGLTGGTISSEGTIALEAIDTIDTQNSGRTVIQNITTDGYGRLINVESVELEDADLNSWRPIQVNGTEVLANEVNETALLNIVNGQGTTVEYTSDGLKVNVAPYVGDDEINVADNKISIASVNVNKLVQTEGEELILNGGNAVSVTA